jgi:hypothetical protein
MANVSVSFTLTEKEANALRLRSSDDGEGGRKFETVNAFCKRAAQEKANISMAQDRQKDIDALTDAQLDAAIASAKGE